MKVAINTPTGNIGRPLTSHLLDAGEELILLARNPDKVKDFAARGATVHQGSLDDKGFVIEATRGADVLFWLTPPDYGADDLRKHQNMLGDHGADAVKSNRIGRVIVLSSIGAQHAEGTGPIAGLHDAEKKFEAAAQHVLHLRPGYFMENFLPSAPTIASDGAIYMMEPIDAAMDMIATRDIARVASELVRDQSWSGTTKVELVGPENVTYGDAARMIGEAIGKDVKYVQVGTEQTRGALRSMGVSDNVAGTMIEMFEAFIAGKVGPEGDPRRTETKFNTFAREVFAPAFRAMSG